MSGALPCLALCPVLNLLFTKGYLGTVEYDADAKIFHSDIINTRDVITFQGKTVNEIELAFKESINDYISWCEDEGVEPERPYSGKFNVHLSPELHRQIAILANKKAGIAQQFYNE